MSSSYKFQRGYRGPGTPETNKDSELVSGPPSPICCRLLPPPLSVSECSLPQLVLTSLTKQAACQQAPSKQTASMFHGCWPSVSRQASKRHTSNQRASKRQASSRPATGLARPLPLAFSDWPTRNVPTGGSGCFTPKANRFTSSKQGTGQHVARRLPLAR